MIRSGDEHYGVFEIHCDLAFSLQCIGLGGLCLHNFGHNRALQASSIMQEYYDGYIFGHNRTDRLCKLIPRLLRDWGPL